MNGGMASYLRVAMPKDFLIPFARDPVTGALVRREDAALAHRYSCLGCKGALIVREGTRRRHFAHLVATPECAPETVLHRTAKALLVGVVRAWKNGTGERPSVVRTCPRCLATKVQPLPDHVTTATEEQAVEGGRIVDVALFSGDVVTAGLEVLVTHAVDAAKGQALPVPWIELSADAVIANPLCWVPLQDRFRPWNCERCAAIARRRAEEARRLAAELDALGREVGMRLPWRSPYTTVIGNCYADRVCGRRIPIFSWPGHHQWTRRPPPTPRPPTVKYEWSNTLGSKYWANVCVYCGRVQGDYFLFGEGGPLGMRGQAAYDDLPP